MSLLGCRVVRGRDWKWDQQDGGEGCVGTVVSLENFSDGRTLPRKTALVCWDSGGVADYRIGLNGCYDLRIYDSAPGEVLSPAFTCNGCSQSRIAGSRWHCTQCYDYDLCNVCYMNDVHNKEHQFERFDASDDRTNGTKVTPRSRATKVRAKGLFPGTKVKRGKDWDLDSELGTMTGYVVGVTAWENVPRSAVIVKWGESLEVSHRVGHRGKVDLQTVNLSHNGPFYYKEHLQIATSAAELKRIACTGGEMLNTGDRVTIHLDLETLKLMSEGHGGWVTGMEKVIGKVGKISKIDDDGDVFVDFGLMNEWAFHPEAIVKVRDFRPGDKVRVLNNKELVVKYQDGHGGWNNAMETALGQQGNVLNVDHDGDALVRVSAQQWLFNAAALVLESKEEERRPPGEGTGIGNETIEELVLNALLQGLVGSRGIEQLVLATTVGDMDKVKEIIQDDRSLVRS